MEILVSLFMLVLRNVDIVMKEAMIFCMIWKIPQYLIAYC